MKMNIGILAHVDAGKTTITEQMLYTCGVINEIGRVDNGNTTTDGMALEKERGITIRQATVTMNYKAHKINLLDTPGHVDFISEVERSLSVLDAAILAISAKEGVQAQTKVIFNALKKMGIPVIIMINKVDRMGVDLSDIRTQIKEELSDALYLVNAVNDEGERHASLRALDEAELGSNIETLALLDDGVFEAWSSDTVMTSAMLSGKAKTYFNQNKLFPVLNGSALLGLGIEPLLELLSEWVEPVIQEELSGIVYKVDRDSHGNRRCFTRLFGGTLVLRESYPVYGEERAYKILKMDGLFGIKPRRQDAAVAGDVVVLYTDALNVGDVLGELPLDRQLVHIASPTLRARVVAEDLAIRRAVCDALTQLTDEDPFLGFEIHPETEAIELKLFGMVQKEIIEQLLVERFEINTQILEPEIVYRSSIKNTTEACLYMYTADNLLPATVGLVIEPLKVGEGIVYETEVSFGDLKKPFQNAVREGCIFGLKKGMNQLEVTDVKVRFVYSEFNSVDSTPSDFRKVAGQVVQIALGKADGVKLEPINQYELIIPQLLIGRAIADILRMRGSFEEPMIKGEMAVIKGILPLETCQYYEVELSDYTSGKGIISYQAGGYQIAPEQIV
ncbi:MAG: hypothetical protein BGO41_12150 [Clostridiales bacterium 38-18]|nr:MAG: hypothetical protein BGO41_12150 [Clostridiales bacterium 38-18]